MEQNKFEELEPVEVENKPNPEETGLKEYEKLLLAESNRELREKAETLVNIGCFNQVQEPVIDFNDYEYIDYGKKYKGRYSLYLNKETQELVFICPLVENNKGDVDEDKSMKPYAYDCIITEKMDEETYIAVCHAAKNNLSSVVRLLYKSSFVVFFVMLAITLFTFINYFINAINNNNFFAALAICLVNTGVYFLADAIMLPLLVLVSIKYKKYKDQ